MLTCKNIKEQYGNKCATCGSAEGEINLHYPTKTKLQEANIDPFKPLVEGNIIPQCHKCNRAYRDFWMFDERGRIRSVAKATIVRKCNKEVRWKIYKILYKEFKGINPNERGTHK